MKKSSDRKDKLERFVRDNREAFDTFDLHDTFWERIESKLDTPPLHPGINKNQAHPPENPADTPLTEPKGESHILHSQGKPKSRSKKLYFDWRIAAGIILAIGASWIFYLNNEYGLSRDPKVAFAIPAYAKEFNQYTQTIDRKRGQLIKLTSDNPELYKEFSTDLDRLATSYQNLRSDLPQSPDQQALVQAMIKNLQWQIDLLNQQLLILEQLKNTNHHEEDHNTVNL